MRVIFCADPLNRRRPDPLYAREAEAAGVAGFDCSLINFEALVDGQDAEAAARGIPPVQGWGMAVYRGWMLRLEDYEPFYAALQARHISLINGPLDYRDCHFLPHWYPLIQEHTPRSVWLEADTGLGIERIMQALRPFGAAPVIVKDYVKSRKHEWAEACYIPSAADRQAVERVVSRFLELQGADLDGGLVFRAFVPFEPLAQHSKSGMPLTREFRLFFLDGKLLLSTAYWDEGDYGDLQPPIERFQPIAQKVQSRFFTMDVAKRLDGDWLIVELGDGQVAGLPERADVSAFYRALAARLAHP